MTRHFDPAILSPMTKVRVSDFIAFLVRVIGLGLGLVLGVGVRIDGMSLVQNVMESLSHF